MKQLKFMLAAATVIGLATAAQAETQVVNKPIDSENFNAMNVGDKVTADTDGFDYTGVAAENDSEIVEVTSGDNALKDNALKVNTGTYPLLRAVDFSTAANPVDLTADKFQKLYIDTKVKFTVTPYTDEVDAKTGDKLMIYLKEYTNEVGVIEGTNLVVKAAAYEDGEIVSRDYTIDDVEIDLDEFYNLRVTAKSIPMSSGDNGVGYWTVFQVYINDFENPLATTVESGFDDYIPEDVGLDLTSTFVSLQTENLEGDISSDNNEITEVTYVGFAGEGYVDDLVFTKDVEEETSVDFTFTITKATGVSAVQWTIGDGSVDGLSTTVKDGKTTITITNVEYEDWYVADGDYVKNWTMTADKNVTGITVGAKQIASGDNAFEVEEGQTAPTATAVAEALKITNTEFTGTTPAAQETLKKGLNWAKAYSYAPTKLNEIKFNGVDPDGVEAEAYLLNCEAEQTAIDEAKEDFVLSAFTVAADGTVTFGVGENGVANGEEYGNGKVEVRGKVSLDAQDWVKECDGAKFFKAFLTK